MSICPMSGSPCPNDPAKLCRFCRCRAATGENPIPVSPDEVADLAQQHPEEALELPLEISDEDREYLEEVIRVSDAGEKLARGERLDEHDLKPIDPRFREAILHMFVGAVQDLIPANLKPENQFQCQGCGG